MPIPLIQVDAFTDKPFGGNPAAVCLLEAPADERWMQHVAREMNLSETAFLSPEGDGYLLRWFTPTVEIDLCGHATLGSAHVLWETKRLAGDSPARFRTKSGTLTCHRRGSWIEMDFPSTPPKDAAPPPGLAEALKLAPRNAARSRFDWLVEVESEDEVRGAAPDFGQLKKVEARGVIVTARGSKGFDFVSRFFAPAAGVDEDPVTGSAHCCLTPYWSSRLGKLEMVAWQASARGGEVRVKLQGDRVILSGQAVTVLRGELI
jgi:PhzF family phenazine biosynthesis protein